MRTFIDLYTWMTFARRRLLCKSLSNNPWFRVIMFWELSPQTRSVQFSCSKRTLSMHFIDVTGSQFGCLDRNPYALSCLPRLNPRVYKPFQLFKSNTFHAFPWGGVIHKPYSQSVVQMHCKMHTFALDLRIFTVVTFPLGEKYTVKCILLLWNSAFLRL